MSLTWVKCIINEKLYKSSSLVFILQLFELMNFLAENFVFLYIGVAVFTFHSQQWNPLFILAALVSFATQVVNVLCLDFKHCLINYSSHHRFIKSFIKDCCYSTNPAITVNNSTISVFCFLYIEKKNLILNALYCIRGKLQSF